MAKTHLPAPDPEHLRFAVLASDTVLFTVRDGTLCVRLVKVDRPPHFSNSKGFPGGLIHPSETGHDSALRHLQDKAHVDTRKVHLDQLYTFSTVDRDPRGRVVALSYLGLVPWDRLSPAEREDADETWWAPVSRANHLAYDHDEMLRVARERLESRITYTTLISKLMPEEFTLTELEHTYEAILKSDLDKRNFRKKILKLKILKTVPRKRTGGRFRPAQLYKFISNEVKQIEVL